MAVDSIEQRRTPSSQNDIAKKTTKNKNPKLLFDEILTGTFFISPDLTP